MKRLLIISIVFVLLIGIVSASALSVLWKQGISATSPQAAQVINTADQIMEIQTLAQCTTGLGISVCIEGIIERKVMGQVYGSAIKVAGPEVQKIISTYQQLDLYKQAGAELIDLQMDEDGMIQEGKIQFSGEKESEIGSLIGPDIENKDISIRNIEFSKKKDGKDGKITLIFKEKDSSVNIRGNFYGNIVPQDTAGHPTFIEMDENGRITKADFTVNEVGGIYSIGNTKFQAPPNSRVFFDKETGIRIKAPEGSEIEQISWIKESNLPDEYEVVIEGKYISLYGNPISGKVTVSDGKIVKIWEKTNAIVNGIEHQVDSGKNLKISYDKNFDSTKLKDENYFNYGIDRIALGGSGFKSILRQDNVIFPEYKGNKYVGSYGERYSRLEFTAKGGNLEVIRNSQPGNPLALKINAYEGFNIKNGGWILEADGNDVYADFEGDHFLAHDIKLNYINNNDESITYELNVDNKFRNPLGDEEKIEIRGEIDSLKKQKKDVVGRIHSLLDKTPKVVDLADSERELESNKRRIEFLKKKLKDTTDLSYIRHAQRKIESLEKKSITLKDYLEKNSEFKEDVEKYKKLDGDEFSLSRRIHSKERTEKFGKIQTGSFGQKLTSEDGNSRVSYSEFVEGFTVIKNTDVKAYFFENGKLSRTETTRENYDVLAGPLIPDSKYQTCADTQVELRALWEFDELKNGNQESIKFKIANGKELTYNLKEGIYTIWDVNQKAVSTKHFNPESSGNEFKEWVENIQAYSNTGSLRASLNHIVDIDDLKPGDIITLHPDKKTGYGHTKAIKEIVLINGVKYYKLFAGSDPVIDARIYPELTNEIQLEYDMITGKIVASRFGSS